MEDLPIEILRHICFMIKTDSPGDLPQLRLTNRLWSDLVAPFLFKSLRVKFRDLAELQETASEVDHGGKGQTFLKYARKLDVVCLYKPYIETKKARSLWQVKDWGMEFADYIRPAHRDTFLEHQLSESIDSDLRFLNLSVDYYSEKEWQPLVSLIARLEHLEELNYAAHNMFPAPVHQFICQYHPKCRVNIWFFQDLSIDVPGRGMPDPGYRASMDDPFEISILQSPGLHTFAVNYFTAYHPSGGQGFVHLDELLPFVCMGQNLKRLTIQAIIAPNDGSIMKIKQEWKDFSADFKPVPAACLDSLSLHFGSGRGPLEEILLKLGNLIDLSRLRSLDMSIHSSPSLLAQAASLFHSLERLFVTMDPWAKPNEDVNADDEEMVAAVRAFAPVRFLCLRGLRSTSSLDHILQHHGTSLQGLAIEASEEERLYMWGYKYPVLDSQHISQLVGCCPSLQELRLQIKRRGGSPQECNIYRAIGQFTQLHTLILDLHCDPRQSPIGPEIASTTCLRETLINAATDESLAMSIWDLIAASQPSKRLRKLRIIPFGANFYSREEKHVIRPLSRSFLLTRPDFCCQTKPDVREIGKEAWELWREDDIFQDGRLHIPQQVYDLLNEIWPSTRGYRTNTGASTGRASLYRRIFCDTVIFIAYYADDLKDTCLESIP
ncbi:uncharacterized protein P174DRAFT_405823 [Aspergillus novofumigatus IBT 16806]|uniref:Uncharacterized protein n=1 Tax=Aspergillus novofumigatus (strain IBT 16806) TaxID=1392255 RepID=A0A2I1C7X6_ASPN1|nr:uncharacterized protein P174DRAFT_405823 [Aspergillus novofumigatus IBT 16806]PKX93696.1 hypothetical protein P174DRAFT_405823 [Aspergillus novofumigatus IBT 16806]